MPISKYGLKLLILPVVLGLTSCVKDVDLDQKDEFELTPSLAVDLANFSFASTFFFDEEELPVTHRADTIPLQIMDQDLMDHLVSVDFHYSFSNTFERSFENVYTFYSFTDEPLYRVPELRVGPGEEGNPAVFDTIVTVDGGIIDDLKRARKLGISLAIGDEEGEPRGDLDVKVTAVYNFEFDI